MAFIGSLITTVKANTNPLKKNLKSASRTISKFGNQIKGIGIGVAKFGAVLGGVAAAALIAFTARAMEAIDATAKLGRELGITTEALIGYKLAAGLSGVSSEVLFKAISKMARTVGEARSGITTGTKALQDFGLEIEDLQGLTTQQTFERFADEIAKIPDPMERAAKASLIFGRAGGKLLNFLSLGSEGLERVKAEADALGISFNSLDAAKVEAANDAILKLQTLSSGLGNTIAIKVAPALTLIADKMSNFIKESGGINTIVSKSIKQMTNLFIEFIDAINLAKASFEGIAAVARVGSAGVIRIGANLADLFTLGQFDTDPAEELANFLDQQAVGNIESMRSAMDDFKNSVASKAVVDFASKIQKDATKAAESIEEMAGKQQKLNEKIREEEEIRAKNLALQKKQEEEYKKVIDAATKIFEETRTPIEKIEAEIKSVVDLMNSATFDEKLSEGLHRKIVELQKAKQELLLSDKIEQAKEGKAAVEAIAERLATPMERIIAEQDKIQQLQKEGHFEGREDIFRAAMQDLLLRAEKIEEEDMKKKQKQKEDEVGTFKELDLKNIDVAGLTGKENVEKKQLTEAEKTNKLLKQIVNKDDQKVPVAV